MATDDTKGTNDATRPAGWEMKGYPRLARRMANTTNLVILRRFNHLNIFNLLSLQAELVDLEEQLNDKWEEDDTSTDESEKQHSNFFKRLREPTKTKEDKEQWKLLLKIRELLSKYNEAVIQVETLMSKSPPDDQSLNTFHVYMNKIGNENFLTDCEAGTWLPGDSKEDKTDLFALLSPSGENDGFQRWISSKPLLWFHKHVFDPIRRRFPSKEKEDRRQIDDEEIGIVNYNDATLDRISIFVALFIALGFLIGAVVALYFNKDTLQRIGIMAGFTAAFGLSLTFFTNATRIEIFSSVAGFAAVEVLFIGSVAP